MTVTLYRENLAAHIAPTDKPDLYRVTITDGHSTLRRYNARGEHEDVLDTVEETLTALTSR